MHSSDSGGLGVVDDFGWFMIEWWLHIVHYSELCLINSSGNEVLLILIFKNKCLTLVIS